MKLVSIIIPTYNMAKFLGKAISSALNQSYFEVEVIVIDNCSTDATEQIVQEYKDKRLRYVKNDKNLGATANFNKGISLATGEFIKFLEADDILADNCIEILIHEFDLDKEIGMICTGRYYIDSDDKKNGEYVRTRTKYSVKPYKRSRFLVKGNEFGTPSDVILRKSSLSLLDNDYFRTDYEPYLNDWDFWYRIALIVNVKFLDQKLCYVRRHPQQIGKTGALNLRDITACFKMIDKLHRKSWLFKIFILHFSSEYTLRAIKSIVKSPFKIQSWVYYYNTRKKLYSESILNLFIWPYLIFIFPLILILNKFND